MKPATTYTVLVALAAFVCAAAGQERDPVIGSERAITRHLVNGDEHRLARGALIDLGRQLFAANWTEEDGAGRPLSKGNGRPLSDRGAPLVGAQAFNRISGPDANSCAGCHNAPHGLAGGGGDFTTNVFVRAERFDFVTFDRTDQTPLRGSLDETRRPVTLQTVGNLRLTPGLFGAGYLEMLARQMTADLQAIRDATGPGQSRPLVTKGVSFGALARRGDGTWDVSRVEGLPVQSLRPARPGAAPGLVVQPWHQSGSAASLREFAIDAYNRHLGIQAAERFGAATDSDGDDVIDEMTPGDVTAVVAFMAALPVPGRVIPNDPAIEREVLAGERLFSSVGCASCHIPALPLDANGWMFREPGAASGAAGRVAGRSTASRTLMIDLTDSLLPAPRLPRPRAGGALRVPAFTDFKLHDITDQNDPDASEPLDINEPEGSKAFLAGNRRFLTRRLWGAANEPPYFHHGQFATMREAVLAHAGEALASRRRFEQGSAADQRAIMRFLETLQVLPPGTTALVVDEHFKPKPWPR